VAHVYANSALLAERRIIFADAFCGRHYACAWKKTENILIHLSRCPHYAPDSKMNRFCLLPGNRQLALYRISYAVALNPQTAMV
jgi:hypothetical protein